LLGAPFLLTHPLSYIGRAFDLGRVFLYKWTVNWRFLPEGLFLSRSFHALLLLCHVGSLVVFAATKWMNIGSFKKSFPHKQSSTISPQEVLYIMFTSNFIGICFSRSLHFQFYVWYFYSLPMLVYWSQLPIIISVLLLFTLEYSWNVYPSTTLSSLLLHLVHFVIFVRLLSLPRPSFMSDYKIKTIDKKY
jgi:alpha-1,3-mannosyltransferase